jgi:predicted DNA-binding transcriptional regulator YafY
MTGKKKSYEVNPLGMAFVDGLTYLIASLNEHGDPVLLLLHRILKAEPLDRAANVPDDFDLDEYIARELTFPVGGTIKLKLRFFNVADVQRLEEAPLSPDQKIVAGKNGAFELTATMEDTLQLHWWLHGYGGRVEVVAPKHLRDEFAETALALAERYRTN